MRNTHPTIQMLVLLLLIVVSQAATGSQVVGPSLKYVNSGKITVDTSASYNLQLPHTWSPLRFHTTYPNGLQGNEKNQILMSIVDLRVVPSSNRIQFSQSISQTSTSFTTALYSNYANFIQRLSYRYIIISGTYIISGSIFMISLTYNMNDNLAFTGKTGVLTFSPAVNTTGGTNCLCFINGMDINTTSSSLVSMIITATLTSSNTASFSFRSTTISFTNNYVYYLKFDFLVYNDAYYNRVNFANFYFGTVQSTGGTFPMTYSSATDYTTVTAIGLNSIAVQGDGFLDLTIDLSSVNSISIASANTANIVKSFSVQYLIMLTYYCNPVTPYFYSTSNICYDICPSRTYTDAQILSCSICPYDCYTCSGTSCLTCNQDDDFRELNSTSGRCVAMKGYFQNLSTVCSKCSAHCLECLNLTNCLNCISGTYLANGVCTVCPTGCSTCISASQCQTCSSGYTLNSNYICYNTCPSSQYFNTTTFTCIACPNGCTSCVSSSSCTNCPYNTYLSNGVCYNCPSLCRTCLSSSYCFSCQAGSYMRSDQLCYSTCLSRTYGDSSLICVSCPYDCLTCNASGLCTSCSSTDRRVLNTSTARCVPDRGYYDNQTTICVACPTSCSTCLSATICTSCVVGYYLANGICPLCPIACQSCLSSTYCQACKTGNYLNLNTNLCATTCPSGFYPDTSTLICNSCSSNCLTCTTTPTICTSCTSGMYLSGQICMSCPSGCMTCTSASNCQSCIAGFNKNSTGGCVSQCPIGQYLVASSSNCVLCSSTCMTCSNGSTCTSCYPGYYLDSTSSCNACPKGQYLNLNMTCSTTCPIRYYPDTKFNTCQPCPYDCYSCDNASKCTSCNQTTDFRTLNSQTSRCLPLAGYFDNSNSNSSPCPSNCATCTSSTACSQCNTAYYLSNVSCVACPINCTSCLTSTYCSTCKNGYYLRADNLCYTSCLDRTYLYQNMICVSCPYSCLTCNASGYCFTCSVGDFRVLKEYSCVPIDGYYDNRVATCAKCPDGCATCQSFSNCTTCKEAYYLSSNATCLPCAANCKICINGNSCDTCNSYFSLNSGACKVSQSSQSGSSSMPIGIMAGVAIGGLIAVIAFCIYRKCKGEPKPAVIIKGYDGFASSGSINTDELEAEQSQNEWHPRSRQVSAQQDCSICLFQQTFFKTSCGHHFHVMCIIEWVRKRNNCPNCRESLNQKKHKIYCRRCHLKYKVIKVNNIKEMTSKKREQSETVCEDCKLVPI